MTKFSNEKYDLEERTAKLAEEIIRTVKSIKLTSINKRIVDQLIGSGGSLGANYCEANEAESKQDFKHKIGICKKETKETKHWLRLLAVANPEIKDQLLLIFSKILKSSRANVL